MTEQSTARPGGSTSRSGNPTVGGTATAAGTAPDVLAEPEPEPAPVAFDLAVVTDLRFPGGTSSSLVDEITAAVDAGYRIGLVHLANPRLGRALPVHPGLRRLLADGAVRLLLPGEPATARLLIVKHPMVFSRPPGGRFPIDVGRVLVTVGQVPADRHGHYYDPVEVDRHITEAFGHRPTWAPVSPAVRATLPPDVHVADDDWVEVIDVDAWAAPSPASDGTRPDADFSDADLRPSQDRIDPRPVIGRHSRPDPRKWPADPDDLRAAYPVDGSVRVRVLGGADAVADVLGEVPATWEVLPFGAMPAAEFLHGLDAFVYFHHPDLTEAFGRTILEAVAAGVPAVVGEHFRPLFGEACLYADPSHAVATATALLADPAALSHHLHRARQLVVDRFSHQAHLRRLDTLIGPPAEPDDGPTVPPKLDLAPTLHRTATTNTLVSCLGLTADEVEPVLRAVDAQRREPPGIVPVVVISVTKPVLADDLGIETRIVTNRRNWKEAERWEDYAQRRLRQLAGHYDVDTVVPADVRSPDAWIAMQVNRRPAPPATGAG